MIIAPERFSLLINQDGTPSDRLSEWMEEITRQINLNTPLTGTGSPEGVLIAEPYQIYLDTSAGAENIQYRKMTGTGNTGWILT